MTAVAAPRPEVHGAPAHLIGIHMNCDIIFFEITGLEFREDDALWLNIADIVSVVVAAEYLLVVV